VVIVAVAATDAQALFRVAADMIVPAVFLLSGLCQKRRFALLTRIMHQAGHFRTFVDCARVDDPTGRIV
jgi:hypothetical protein